MVVPSFSALFASSLGNVISFFEFLCDMGPIVEAVLWDKFGDSLIFLNNGAVYLKVPWLSIHLMWKLYLFIGKGYNTAYLATNSIIRICDTILSRSSVNEPMTIELTYFHYKVRSLKIHTVDLQSLFGMKQPGMVLHLELFLSWCLTILLLAFCWY